MPILEREYSIDKILYTIENSHTSDDNIWNYLSLVNDMNWCRYNEIINVLSKKLFIVPEKIDDLLFAAYKQWFIKCDNILEISSYEKLTWLVFFTPKCEKYFKVGN